MREQRDTTSPWFVCRRAKPSARARLLCFPSAGASGAVYRGWVGAFPEDVEVCPIELPGRWSRNRERCLTSMPALVDALGDGLAGFLDKEVCLFGYSLGALVAFEFARYLRRHHGREPLHLFVAARRAPGLATPGLPPISQLPHDEFVDQLSRRYGGIPPAILRDQEMLKMFVPIMRADIELIETYAYEPEPPLRCPIHAFGGAEDRTTELPTLEGWRAMTRGEFQCQLFPGGHFFINQSGDDLLAAVRSAIDRG